jgi:hypothetical protein
MRLFGKPGAVKNTRSIEELEGGTVFTDNEGDICMRTASGFVVLIGTVASERAGATCECDDFELREVHENPVLSLDGTFMELK